MHPHLKCLALACSASVLLACATGAPKAPLASVVLVPAASADESYLLARQHHLARSRDDALRLYRQALAVDPQHVNARNGMATLLAEQGQFAQAIAIWRTLTDALGAQPGPATAYLFNNLGHAYFLAGDYARAQATLERACLLDPLDALAWERLGSTLAQRGDDRRAAQMLRQADVLRKHDLRADALLAGGSHIAASPVQDHRDAITNIDVLEGGEGLLILRRVSERTVTAQAAPPNAVATLEISNGNGAAGLARAVSRALLDPALKVVRLSNEPTFSVRRTRIEYRAPLRPLAERLARQVWPGAALAAMPPGQGGDLRLVLGQDMDAGSPALTLSAR